MAKPEADFVRKLLKALQKEFPGYWVKTSPSRFDKAGRPDILGTSERLFGTMVGIECKAPSVKPNPSPAQQLNINQIIWAQGVAFTTNSIDHAISTLRDVQSHLADKSAERFADLRFMLDNRTSTQTQETKAETK